MVVQVVLADYVGISKVSLIIFNIKNLLEVHSDYEVKFIKHQTNSVTHLLIKSVNS